MLAPVLLLLLLQLQFLPYHSETITWTARVALVFDLSLIWWLWLKILGGRADIRGGRPWHYWWNMPIGGAVFVSTVVFSWAVATFPGEWLNRHSFSALAASHVALFEGPVVSRQRTSPFSSTLVLPSFNVFEAQRVESPEKVGWKKYTIDLRDRHLEGAVFEGATLGKADLTGAFLGDAKLNWANLNGASFESAQLQGAELYRAQLRGAAFMFAHLEGASLSSAQLQGAELMSANLEGASLLDARLQSAWLPGATLQGATLEFAQLQGASLSRAQLQGASLAGANLWGASLDGAQLQGALLDNVRLRMTDLTDTKLWRAHGPPRSAGSITGTGADWSASYCDSESKSQPWTAATFDALKQTILAIPEGKNRGDALMRIGVLECSEEHRCNGSEIWDDLGLRRALDRAKSVNGDSYRVELAKELNVLVCDSDEDARYIVGVRELSNSGIALQLLIVNTGDLAPALIDRILSDDCPGSKNLTDANRRNLRQLKSKLVKNIE